MNVVFQGIVSIWSPTLGNKLKYCAEIGRRMIFLWMTKLTGLQE
jgi:hypothetical protein